MPEYPIKYPCTGLGCDRYILFTEKDHEYYIQRGFVDDKGMVNKPKRCKVCREKRKNPS